MTKNNFASYDPIEEVSQITAEADALKKRLLSTREIGQPVEDKPAEEKEANGHSLEENPAKVELMATVRETSSLAAEIDYNISRQEMPSRSIKDILLIMDKICQKLDLIPQSEQITLRTTNRIMNALNHCFEEYQNTHQLDETEKKLLADFFSSQLKAITPRTKSK